MNNLISTFITLLLLCFAATQAWAQANPSVSVSEANVCSTEFINGDSQLRTVCDVGYTQGRLSGPLKPKVLADALVFPHWPRGANQFAELPVLDQSLCEPGEFALEADAVSKFLVRLATRQSSQNPEVMTFENIRIDGSFSAPSQFLDFGIRFESTLFCGHADFSNARLNGNLEFHKSVVVSALGSTSEGILWGQSMRSGGGIHVSNSRLGAIILNGKTKAAEIYVTETALGHASFSSAETKSFSLNNTRQYESIYRRTLIEFSKFDHDASSVRYPIKFFANNIDIEGLIVNGLFYSDRLIIDGALAALGSEIGTVRLRDAVLPSVDFRRLKADRVELFGATLGRASGRVNCDIDQALRYDFDFVSFKEANIKGNFLVHPLPMDSNRSSPSVAKAIGLVCFDEMVVGGDFDVSALEADLVDLRRTNVDGTLMLASETYGAMKFPSMAPFFDMRSMEVSSLLMSDTLVLPSTTRMAKSEIDSFGFVENEEQGLPDVASLRLMVRILDRIEPVENRVLAYIVFENALQDTNLAAAAQLYYLRERARTRDMKFGFQKSTRTLIQFLNGYGARPERTVTVILLATIIGAVVAWHSSEGWWFLMRQSLSHRGPRGRRVSEHQIFVVGSTSRKRNATRRLLWFWLIFDSLVLSFDRLVPLVSISKPHKELEFRSQRWTRMYFVFHSLLGFLLAGTVVATISQAIGLAS